MNCELGFVFVVLNNRKFIFGGGRGWRVYALRHRRYKLKLEEINKNVIPHLRKW